ncbi:MAG: hypothetical protein ASARMPRED_009201 [Alectoria sarmentosa]|nr:MAG: hypothetical protein ASARMPRED_009201 [Alectoria sarmentosa]
MATTQSVQCFGKKKTATAVAHCKAGKGLVKVNGKPLALTQPEILRFKVYEPLLIVGLDKFANVDIRVRVSGGGHTSQIYAIRQAIAKSIVAYYQKYVDEYAKNQLKQALVTGFTGLPTSVAPASCLGITNGTTENDLINGVCKNLTLIFARGTTENGNIGDIVGPPFVNALVSMLGKAQVAVQGVNNYPADVQDFLAGGSVTGRYSQGAQVAHNAVNLISQAQTNFINSVVLFGDPDDGEAFGKVPANNVSVDCHTGVDLPPGILCGIDLLSFTTSAQFRGIKKIPPGWHFVFTSETLSLSPRDGFWFHVPTTTTNSIPLIVRKWDTSTGSLLHCSDPEGFRAGLPTLWEKNLSPYRQSVGKETKAEMGDWAGLTEHVSPRLLGHLTQSEDWKISSASCAKEDRDEIPGLTAEDVGEEERELGTLGIDLRRMWRQGAVGRERTEAALDSSWALSDIVERWRPRDRKEEEEWGNMVLGQIEACFLMVLTVANYSCLEEWKRCVGLVLTCKRAVREKEEWFGTFLVLLRRQLERSEDVEGGLFDLNEEGGTYLKRLLKGFKRTLAQVFGEGEGEDVRDEMEALEAFLKGEYGWELGEEFVRRGMLELEDGEQVEMEMEEMDGEDERGEYAPVVVHLDNSG